MIKKNLWVVALLTALALTAFSIGCIEPLAESGDTGTYREVEIKEFNAWGGNALFQSGWGTDGAKWDSGKKEVKSIGLSIEDLQAAKYLVVEVNDGFPKNNFETIWDGWDADGNKTGDWAQFSQVTSAAGDLNPGMGTRDGNILKLEMAKIIKDYSTFRNKNTVAITLLIQHWGNGGTAACIKSAKLLVSDEPVPFVPVGSLRLSNGTTNGGVSAEFYWTNEFELVPKIRPEDATNQKVIWAIQGWKPGNGYVGSDTEIDLTKIPDGETYSQVQAALIKKVNWKQEEIILDSSFWPNETATKNVLGILTAPDGAGSLGTVTIKAVLKEGTQNEDGTFKDVVGTFTVQILNPPPFTYKVNGAEQTTVQYGAVDNGGVSGGKLELTADGKGYTATYSPTGGQYGNSAHYIEITFPAGKKLDDYKQLTCHYVSENCDLTGKSVRLKAMTTKPPRTYNPGPYISTISFASADGFNGGDTDLTFDFYKDNASNADGTTNQGIYNKGVGADLSAAGTDAGNAGKFIDEDDVNLKTANKIYIWILPWGGVGTEFTISDINFVAK